MSWLRALGRSRNGVPQHEARALKGSCGAFSAPLPPSPPAMDDWAGVPHGRPDPPGEAVSLQRRTPLRAQKRLVTKPKGKGNGGEREVIDILKAHGWHGARRNFASGGYGGADVINGPEGCSIEVKRCERAEIWKWLAQCEEAARPTDIPMVVFRRNNSTWQAVVPLEELLPLLALRERG